MTPDIFIYAITRSVLFLVASEYNGLGSLLLATLIISYSSCRKVGFEDENLPVLAAFEILVFRLV